MSIFDTHTGTNDFWETAAEKSVHFNHDKTYYDPNTLGSGEKHFSRIVTTGPNPFQPLVYLEELLQDSKGDLRYPALITEATKENLAKPASNLYSTIQGAVIVILESKDRADFTSEHDAISQGCLLADKLLAYLAKYLKDNPLDGKIIYSHTSVSKIGPVLDQYFGARLDYTIALDRPGTRFCYDADDWV